MTPRFIALAALLLAGTFFVKDYIEKIDLRLKEYVSVYEFLSFLKQRIGSFLEPVPKLCIAFYNNAPKGCECPFTDAMMSCDVAGLSDKLSLMDEDDVAYLKTYLSKLGGGFKAEELEALGTATNYYEERYLAVKEKSKSVRRLVPALFALGYTAVLLLFL